MSVTVRELAELVHGKVHGDGERVVHAARPLSEAQPDDITFLECDKHALQLANRVVAAAVVAVPMPLGDKTLIQVADPLMAFVAIVQHLHGKPRPQPVGIDAHAAVDPTAQVGAEASIQAFVRIGPGAVVGQRCRLHAGVVVGADCRIGDDVVLYPNVVLYDGTVLGDRVIVHANSVLGADGFGYRFQNGRHVKVPQLGHVEVGDDVEIGACTTIDRGTFQATRIGTGTKIDNLVQVGHNCQIGPHNILVSQVGIAGSTSTGSFVVMAGQVGVADHVHIGDRAVIGAKAGVTKDVAPGQRMLGAPATPEREQKRILMTLERLPEMRRELRRIKQHLDLPDEEVEQGQGPGNLKTPDSPTPHP